MKSTPIEKKVFLFLMILFAFAINCFATWDNTTPAGSEAKSQGDDRIRELKIDLEEAFQALQTNATHYFPGADPANPRYIPVISTLTTAGRPTTNGAPGGREIVNISSNCLEIVANDRITWSCLDVVPSSSVFAADLAANVAGDGLGGEGVTPLRVNASTESFSIVNDTITVRVGGIKNGMIADSTITGAMINSTYTITTRPAFFSYLNNTLNNVTGDTSELTVPFDTEDYDQASNMATSTFTAPVTGIYHFDVVVNMSMGSSHDSGYIRTTLVTTSKRVQSYITIGTSDSAANVAGIISTDIKVTAGEEVYVLIYVQGVSGGGTKDMDILGLGSTTRRSYFSGHLVY